MSNFLSKIAKSSHSRGSSPSLEPTNGPDSLLVDSKQPFSLSILLESPPVVMYGPPSASAGYLLSGLLFFTVPYATAGGSRPSMARSSSSSSVLPTLRGMLPQLSATQLRAISEVLAQRRLTLSLPLVGPRGDLKEVTLTSVTLSLNQVVTYGKPFLPPSSTLTGCAECRTKTTNLARWDVLSQPTVFVSGKQTYPFSHLLPGSLPPTCSLGSSGATTIRYELVAVSKGLYRLKSGKEKESLVQVKMPIRILRSIIRGQDKTSLRVFPPLNVTVAAGLPSVMFPKADFIVELKIDGLVENNKRWRMRRLNWRLEETVQVRARTCDTPYHVSKLRVLESHIRLTERHTTANSTYVLGTRDSLNPELGRPVPTPTTVEDEAQEIPTESEELAAPFLHPLDHMQEEALAAEPQQDTATPSKENDNDLYLQEVRILEKGTIREGWKSDYSGAGVIEMPVEIHCKKLSTGLVNYINKVDSRIGSHNQIDKSLDIGSDANCSGDVNDPELGIYVTHQLIMEANLAEELVQAPGVISINHKKSHTLELNLNGGSSHSVVPTGITRLFRMRFKLNLTERSGFGISWDEEVPPQYNLVSTFSPPSYGDVLNVEGEMANLQI